MLLINGFSLTSPHKKREEHSVVNQNLNLN